MPVTDEISSAPLHPALVTILRASDDISQDSAESLDETLPVSFNAAVISREEALMQLRTPVEIPVYSALKIETGEALWLGEAEKCEPQADSWLIRVRLHHVLKDFETLARLAERFGTVAPKRASVQA